MSGRPAAASERVCGAEQEQASWVCQCDESVVQRLEQDFKVTLQQQSSLDQWATWLDNVVSQVLKPHQGSPSFPKAARQFLLKWSFYRYRPVPWLRFRSVSHRTSPCVMTRCPPSVAPWSSETSLCAVQPVSARST